MYSRGVFRRFLRYIELCLDSQLETIEKGDSVPFSEETIERVLPKDVIASDWETEMWQIFQHGSSWRVALYVIFALAEACLTQTELRQVIRIPDKKGAVTNVGSSELSTILKKLEDYGYVKRENTLKGKLVSLNA